MSNQRLTQLRTLLDERHLQAVLITSAANRRYLSGFTGSAGALLVTHDAALLFTDSRYARQAAHEATGFAVIEMTTETALPQLLAQVATERQLAHIACEAEHMTLAQYQRLDHALQPEGRSGTMLIIVNSLVDPLREVKDTTEIALLRHAIAITDAALAAVLPTLRPDITERQAAWMLEVALRERGADRVAFPIIVAAGPHAAWPHAQPGDEPLGTGRPIIIDMGACYQGYHADLTRTIILGEADAQFRQIYDIVLTAQQRAIAGLRAGIASSEVDALARDYITAAGFGPQFCHGLGHGVGLEIHEGPALRRRVPDSAPSSTAYLRAGNVFSIEPGIYLEGWGAVRLEDLVLLHADHGEVLSQAKK